MLTKVWNDENEHSVKIEPTIKAIGILSKGIKQILGEDTLKIYLEKLMFVEMNTYRIVEEFEDISDPDREIKKFKVILKKQKQLISFLTSYSYFITNMETQPGERECQHFYDLSLSATRNFKKLYQKWRPHFLEALSLLIVSLSKYNAIFIHWIVRFIKQSVGDIITSQEGLTPEEQEEAIDDAVQFWQGLLEATKSKSEQICIQIYDTLLNTLTNFLTTVVGDSNVVSKLEASSSSSRNPFLSRLSSFLLSLIPKCDPSWFSRWYPNYVSLIHKLLLSHSVNKLDSKSNSKGAISERGGSVGDKVYELMAVPLLTLDTKELIDPKNIQTYETMQK